MIRAPGRHLALLALPLLAWGCEAGGPAEGDPLELALEPLASPAEKGALFPFVASGPEGTTYLTWTQPLPEGGHSIRLAALAGGEWTQARTITSGDRFFVNWADFPSVHALPDGTLATHWLARSGEGTYDYDVQVATSADGGATWSEPVVLHRDGIAAEHGFVSFFPSGGGFGAVWLDGRNTKGGHGEGAAGGHDVTGHGAPETAMTLHSTVLNPDGTLAPTETMLDLRICDCCQTAAAVTSQGPVVVYRDRSAQEVRDISVVRQVEGVWTEPATLHDDQWVIPGCPVNGPALAARGDDVVAAWFTGAEGIPRTRLAFSADAGATWGDAIEVDDGNPLGRVDVEILEDGSAFVVWLEAAAGETEALIRARRVQPDGVRSASTDLAMTPAARSSGFPRMAPGDGGIVLAWTDPSETGGVRVMRVRVDP
jgi:hypothetical protein